MRSVPALPGAGFPGEACPPKPRLAPLRGPSPAAPGQAPLSKWLCARVPGQRARRRGAPRDLPRTSGPPVAPRSSSARRAWKGPRPDQRSHGAYRGSSSRRATCRSQTRTTAPVEPPSRRNAPVHGRPTGRATPTGRRSPAPTMASRRCGFPSRSEERRWCWSRRCRARSRPQKVFEVKPWCAISSSSVTGPSCPAANAGPVQRTAKAPCISQERRRVPSSAMSVMAAVARSSLS
jgi:hypothetical protein